LLTPGCPVAAGLITFTPIFAYISDQRKDRYYPILISVISLGLASIAYLFCTTFWHYCLIRILQGISAAGNWTIGLALVNDTFPLSQLGRAMGVVLGGMNIGYSLGPAIGGILYDKFGMLGPCILGLSLSALAFLFRLVIREQDAVQQAQLLQSNINTLAREEVNVKVEDIPEKLNESGSLRTPKISMVRLLCSRPVWLNAFVVVVVASLVAAVEPVIPSWLTQSFNTTVMLNGIAFLGFAAPGLVMSPLGTSDLVDICVAFHPVLTLTVLLLFKNCYLAGYLCDRWSSQKTLITGLIACAIAIPLIALSKTLPMAITTLTILGAVMPLASTPPLPLMGKYVQEHHPHAAGQIYSAYTIAVSVAMFIGNVLLSCFLVSLPCCTSMTCC
jgi:MFS family permease